MDILQPEPHPFQFICETVKLTIEIECWGFNKPRADVYTAYMFQQGVRTIIARVYRALHASLRAYIAHRTRAPHARTARAHRSPHTFAFGGVKRSPLLSLDKYITCKGLPPLSPGVWQVKGAGEFRFGSASVPCLVFLDIQPSFHR